MFDYHMHSCFSGDSSAPVKDMIEAAIQKGLHSICLTDHNDPDFPFDTPCFDLDTPAYFDTLRKYQQLYKDKIHVSIGVELGLQTHLADQLKAYVKAYPFDFIIGSSHLIHRQDPYYPSFFEGRAEHDCYCDYFQTIIDNLQVFSDFDVYGHLDYIVRYGPNKNANYSYDRYQDYLDAILKLLLEKNIGLEINTGGYKYGLGAPNPMPDIIRKYISLGGECFTLGADAHSPEYVGYECTKAIALLKECGAGYLCTFQNRIPTYHKI